MSLCLRGKNQEYGIQTINCRRRTIGKAIVNAAYKIHKELGPGLLERVYEVCMAHELRKAGFDVKRQIDIPICYDGIEFEEGLRLDYWLMIL